MERMFQQFPHSMGRRMATMRNGDANIEKNKDPGRLYWIWRSWKVHGAFIFCKNIRQFISITIVGNKIECFQTKYYGYK